MPDIFAHHMQGPSSSPHNCEVADISGADHEFTNPTTFVRGDGAGVLKLRILGGGNTVYTFNLTGPESIPGRWTHVIHNGTTVSAIHGFW